MRRNEWSRRTLLGMLACLAIAAWAVPEAGAKELRVYHIGNRRIWGLTARILQNLMVRLGLEPEED